MSECERTNCGYYYKATGELYPRCHCPDDVNPASCEDEDEYEREDPDYEMGFDPYSGCYTDDC